MESGTRLIFLIGINWCGLPRTGVVVAAQTLRQLVKICLDGYNYPCELAHPPHIVFRNETETCSKCFMGIAGPGSAIRDRFAPITE